MRVTKEMIHPDLQPFLHLFPSSPVTPDYVDQLRIASKAMRSQPVNVPDDLPFLYRQEYMHCKDGTEIRVVICQPESFDGEVPCVVIYHGGGYAVGQPESMLYIVKRLIQAHPCVCVLPAYILSGEAPYPAGLNSGYDALLWAYENAERLRVKRNQFIVLGESAGAGLMTAITLRARDEGTIKLAFQIPLNPMIDDRMNTLSMIDNNAPIWTAEKNAAFWKLYLEDYFQAEDTPKYAAPARETDYTNLPPAYSFVGSIEPFYDETRIYMENLRKAGVEAKLDVYEGCFHGFAILEQAPIAQTALSRLAEEFKYICENYFA